MAELITSSELGALREVVELGMQTEVSVLSLTDVEVDDGDTQQVWAETASVKGWLWEPVDYPRGGVVGGVRGEAHEFRLYLPIGTDLHVGDRVGVEGEIYNVVNTNASNTYQTELRASLRRLE